MIDTECETVKGCQVISQKGPLKFASRIPSKVNVTDAYLTWLDQAGTAGCITNAQVTCVFIEMVSNIVGPMVAARVLKVNEIYRACKIKINADNK
jgi:hypothetical protein